MHKITGRKTQTIALFITLSVGFICAFSHTGNLHFTQQESFCLQKASGVIYAPILQTLDKNKILENSNPTLIRTADESEKIRNGKKNNRIFSLMPHLFTLASIRTFSAQIPLLLAKSDMTPRYSVVGYLHRSDGKKPASLYRMKRQTMKTQK